MIDFISDLGSRASQALIDLFGSHPDVPSVLPVTPSTRPEFGDFQISACLQLAKPLGKKPRDLATAVQAKLLLHPAIEKAEIAGAGYVNLTVKNAWLEAQVFVA